MSSIRRRRTGQDGVTAVEFALVSVTFFFLLIGIFEVGRLLYGLSAISNAAREGARYGIAYANPHVTSFSACGTGAGMTTAATAASQGVGPLTVLAQENPASGTPLSCTVTVTWSYKPASGFFNAIQPTSLKSQATLYFYNITK